MPHDKGLWSRLTGSGFGDESPESQALRIEQVAVLSRGTPTMALGNLLNAAVTAAVRFEYAPPVVLGPWLGLVWLAAGDHLVRWWWNRRRPPPAQVRRRTLGRAILWSGLAGAPWGAMGLALVGGLPAAYQVFIVFAIGGQAAAAATWLAPLFPAFLAYLAASMAPLILGFAVQDTLLAHAMALMLAAYGAVQVHFAQQAGRTFRDRLRAGLGRERLVGALQASRDGVEREVAVRTEELRASRLLLQTVFDALPVWVFVKDRQRRTAMINRQMALGYGVDPGAPPPSDLSAGLPEEIRERIAGYDRQVLNNGQSLEVPEMPVALPGQKPRSMRGRHGARRGRRAGRAPVDGHDAP
jgi:PAS domain-containing protein